MKQDAFAAPLSVKVYLYFEECHCKQLINSKYVYEMERRIKLWKDDLHRKTLLI